MITYLVGDATYPQGLGLKIIAHVCNNKGGWGKGFVLAISKRWKEPEQYYREFHDIYKLGMTQFVSVGYNLFVANMIAQDGYSTKNKQALSHDALEKCLMIVNTTAKNYNASIHMPRIGIGLGGGNWETIEQIINSCCNVPVFVYDLPKKE